jgi:hypothetical protein
MKPVKKRTTTIVLALSGLLVLPAAGEAATNFGSRLNHNPSNSGECQGLLTPCTLVSYTHPSDPNGDEYSGGAPVGGVVTKFRIRAYGLNGQNPATVTFRLAEISNVINQGGPDSALGKAVATGPTVTINGTDDANGDARIEEFAARTPVKKGDHIAIDGTDVQATYNNSGDEYTFQYNPPLIDGQGARGSTDATGELLVAATIEPDADGDGFGDETQDQCPAQRTTAGACDTTKPSVGSLKLSRRGLSFRLSEAATVKLSVQKARAGRRVGKKCRKPSRSNRNRRRCTRYVKVKGVTVNGKAGLNRVRFSKRLSKGRYRIVSVATDAAGNKRTTTKRFRVRK